jgi:hypothetical protein
MTPSEPEKAPASEKPAEPVAYPSPPLPPMPAQVAAPVTYPYGAPTGVAYPYRPAPQYGYAPGLPIPMRKPAPPPKPSRPVELGMLAGAVVLGDLALWGGTGGFGAAAIFTAVPVGLFFAVRRFRANPRLFAIGALLVAVAARCLYHASFGLALLGVALLAAFAMGLRQRSSFAPEVGLSAVSAVAVLPSRVGAVYGGVRRLVKKTRLGSFNVLPVVIPLGLLVAFAVVFALANPVVAHGFERAWSAITRWIGFPHPLRIGMWALLAILFAVLVRPATYRFKAKFAMAPEGDAKDVSLAIARNALVAVNVLFFGFNALDVAYLWAGSPPPGTDTQHYAHSGTFWLTIALSMTTATIGVLFRKELAFDPRAKLARVLACVWVGQSFILALGAFRRIAMHVERSGLSDLRIVGILGTTLVCVGLALVLVKVFRLRTFAWLVRRQLDALAITLVLYAALPTHLISAKVNVARIQKGEYRPVLHMFAQGRHAESAPELLPLLSHSDARVRQGIAALLLETTTKLEAEQTESTRWTQKDLSRSRALGVLHAHHAEIEAALAGKNQGEARDVLLKIERGANDDWSLEQLLSIPEARTDAEENTRSRY